MLVIGDSLLRGTEAPICHPDTFSREVFCLMGAHICNITKKVTSLVKPEAYHPFFLFHVGSNEAAMRMLWNIKRDFMSQKDVEGIRNTDRVFIYPSSWRLEPKKEWIRWMIGLVVGAMFRIWGSMISDELLRDWTCWHQMGHTCPGGAREFWAASWVDLLAEL